ncbi:MAG: DUF4097 family beta strand repeat protein [Bryobacterales bacterium]|nr:DUF4097 family beta strand repeat protein [Bryobacterales bacterium]MBV9399679.1 DUF4097 family beta strand repeat protein [Bryobacterales bacterium]
MKKLTLLGLALAGALCAQDRLTLPFRDPNAPRKLNVDLFLGSVTVKGYEGRDAIIEYSGSDGFRGRRGAPEPPPAGMHRIGGGREPDISEDNNVITVKGGLWNLTGDLTIQVPVETSVTVKTMTGKSVTIDNISGEIEANNMNGEVNVTNASGSVVANSMNGKVVVSLNKVTPGKNMSFTTMNGTVDVTLPADTKATLKMRADNGDIYSDFDVTLGPRTAPEVKEEKTKSGRVRQRVVRAGTQQGTINGGGAEMQFTTFNGRILIHKK